MVLAAPLLAVVVSASVAVRDEPARTCAAVAFLAVTVPASNPGTVLAPPRLERVALPVALWPAVVWRRFVHTRQLAPVVSEPRPWLSGAPEGDCP